MPYPTADQIEAALVAADAALSAALAKHGDKVVPISGRSYLSGDELEAIALDAGVPAAIVSTAATLRGIRVDEASGSQEEDQPVSEDDNRERVRELLVDVDALLRVVGDCEDETDAASVRRVVRIAIAKVETAAELVESL